MVFVADGDYQQVFKDIARFHGILNRVAGHDYDLPLDAGGNPAFENLVAAGIVLAHQDWIRMKCGSCLSVATDYASVKAFKC